MDFLRRLYPGHADSPAAARLERAPRWATAGRHAPIAPLYALPAADPVHASPADAGMAPPAMPQSGPTEPERTRAEAAAKLVATPPHLHEMRLPSPDPRAPKNLASPAGPRAAQPVRPVQAAADPSRPPAFQQPRPGRETAAVAGQTKPIGAVRPAPGPTAPLRAQTLQQAPRPAKPDAAPVVHVTIDRIDVRLPAPANASAPASKARPASAVAPLADYLRGKKRTGAAP